MTEYEHPYQKILEMILNNPMHAEVFFRNLTIAIIDKTVPQTPKAYEEPTYNSIDERVLGLSNLMVDALAPLKTLLEFQEHCQQHGYLFPDDSEMRDLVNETNREILSLNTPRQIQ